MAIKRRAMSKKTRFEVFKRDSFTCQYCGKSAPDVILHVDHIKPVKEGGTNALFNLITSCVDCNLGKGARELSDNSVLSKQKKQFDQINERREQLELLMQWKTELLALVNKQFDYINTEFSRCTSHTINEHGKKTVLEWIKKFGFETVFDLISEATNKYGIFENDEITNESASIIFTNIGKMCYWKNRDIKHPEEKKLFYLRGIMRKRYSYCNEYEAMAILKKAYNENTSIEELKTVILSCRNWSQWKENMDLYILDGGEDNGD